MNATGTGNFLGDAPAEQTEITAVRAYFGCNAVVSTQFSEHAPPTIKVEFGALYGNKQGSLSKEYSDATPSGAMWMQIDAGRPAAKFFKPGKRYFITFTEAPDDCQLPEPPSALLQPASAGFFIPERQHK